MELLLIIIASALLIPLAIFTDGPVRIVLGLLFVLFFPGYTLMAALFPRKTGLETITRLALSVGTSIALVVIFLLLLNATPWGIQLYPNLAVLFLFTVAMAVIAWRRRRSFAPGERFDPAANFKPSVLARFWNEKGYLDQALSTFLVLAIIGVIGTLGFVIAKPMAGGNFTEFYLLDTERKADYYPSELAIGEEGEVIIGIVNREDGTEVYNVEIVLDGEKTSEIGPINLAQEEKWEQEVSFTPARAGPGQKVEFRLYKESRQLYRTLQLWIDVNGETI
jgi:uncharacterized membrane protein